MTAYQTYILKICMQSVWQIHPLNDVYEVCSNSIRIGIVVVVHWVGCVCNQSWHVRTCLSNSWHKLQMAAFAQLAVVGHGNNTWVYVIAIFMMCERTEQRICIKFMWRRAVLKNIVPGDKSWVYGYDPETKQQLSQWKGPTFPWPKKGRQVRSKTKVKGHVTGIFLFWGYRTPQVRSRQVNN